MEHALIEAQLAQEKYSRREKLGKTGAISPEDLDDYLMEKKLKEADFKNAKADFETAKINLRRTKIYAPITGTINNISLRQGNYATASEPVMSIVKNNSFYITGYFEETKLPNIQIGKKVQIQLMSNTEPLHGHVISIGKAIADDNTNVNSQLLPKVQQTYDWVRLSKRIPVDISLEDIPENINLVSGINATVKIQ